MRSAAACTGLQLRQGLVTMITLQPHGAHSRVRVEDMWQPVLLQFGPNIGSWHTTPPGSLSADTAAGSQVPASRTAQSPIDKMSACLDLSQGACHTPARHCHSSTSVL